MSKLLTEQELRKEVANWFKPYKVSQIFLNNVVKIIHTQKIAHADMVIGKQLPIEIGGKERKENREELRAEQRERNK